MAYINNRQKFIFGHDPFFAGKAHTEEFHQTKGNFIDNKNQWCEDNGKPVDWFDINKTNPFSGMGGYGFWGNLTKYQNDKRQYAGRYTDGCSCL